MILCKTKTSKKFDAPLRRGVTDVRFESGGLRMTRLTHFDKHLDIS